MSQIRAQYKTTDDKFEWVPLKAVLDGDQYVLQVAGIVGGGGATEVTGTVEVLAGVPKHYNGTAGLLVQTVTFSAITKSILIENTHVTANLYISFDGINIFTLPSGETLALDASVTSVELSAPVAGVTYQILTTE